MQTGTIHLSEKQNIEIAHVLMMDIVGYSILAMDEQMEIVEDLKQIVASTTAYSTGAQRGDLIALDAGDGMALVFFGGPEPPVQCALEIAGNLRKNQRFSLRMGINSGPVIRTTDIKGQNKVTGGGINLAQRVMDAGDAGHILLSGNIAEILIQHRYWAARIIELGFAQIKHNERMHFYNLVEGDLGNPAVPEKIRAGQSIPFLPIPDNIRGSGGQSTSVLPTADHTSSSDVQSSAVSASPVKTERPLKIALVYRRNTNPDEKLLRILNNYLSTKGHDVFIDRHLTIGIEWAREIEQRIKSADVVIPLISKNSSESEMVNYEVQLAHEMAQKNGGKPRLLPIRIAYEEALPDPMREILDPLQYALWNDSGDDGRLIEEIETGLSGRSNVPAKPTILDASGGAVPPASPFYIVRPTDGELDEALQRFDSIVLIKGARQMGKTSLMSRGVQAARSRGAKIVITDFQKLNAEHFSTIDKLFLALGEMLVDQLDLDVNPEDSWSSRRGASMNFERFLRREILGKIEDRFIWVLDEVDRLFNCNFGSEVFGLFRSWHNERSLDPGGPWRKLTLTIAYATEPHLFISNLNQSPFNVGTRLELRDFDLEQVGELNRRYGNPLKNIGEIIRFHKLLGGQPFLVRRGLDEMVHRTIDLQQLEQEADRDDGAFGDHLHRILVLLARSPEMCRAVTDILQGRPAPSNEIFYRLRTSGLMMGEAARDVHPRCDIYRTYLERHLL